MTTGRASSNSASVSRNFGGLNSEDCSQFGKYLELKFTRLGGDTCTLLEKEVDQEGAARHARSHTVENQ